MRVRIAVKIFSIALGLLALLAVVAVISTVNVARVRDEVLTVVDDLTPIAQALRALQIRQMEQELHLERGLHAGADAAAAAAAVRREGQAFDALIADAQGLVGGGAARTGRVEDREEFAALRVLLGAIEREHQDFEAGALLVLDAAGQGDRARVATLREMTNRQEQEFLREIARAADSVQTYARQSGRLASEHHSRILRLNVALTATALIAGLLFAALVTGGLVKPVQRLLQGTHRIEEGELDTRIEVTSRDEIGQLTESFNTMAAQLLAKERIKRTFGQYLDPRVVERLLAGTVGAGERQHATVMFTDLQGFSGIAENLTAQALVQAMNRYFTLMADAVVRHGGIVDKFIGDAVMAFWTPPFVEAGAAARQACLAALDQRAQLEEFRRELPDLVGFRKGLPEIAVRIGIATGEVVVGSIGSDRVKGFTVLGDAANLASRLEGAGKIYRTTGLLSDATRQEAAGAVETREIDSIRVAGREAPERIFELLGPAGSLDAAGVRWRDAFERGLTAYRAGDLPAARSHFENSLALRPDDGPARVFLERVEALRGTPQPSGWDGVWTMTQK